MPLGSGLRRLVSRELTPFHGPPSLAVGGTVMTQRGRWRPSQEPPAVVEAAGGTPHARRSHGADHPRAVSAPHGPARRDAAPGVLAELAHRLSTRRRARAPAPRFPADGGAEPRVRERPACRGDEADWPQD